SFMINVVKGDRGFFSCGTECPGPHLLEITSSLARPVSEPYIGSHEQYVGIPYIHEVAWEVMAWVTSRSLVISPGHVFLVEIAGIHECPVVISQHLFSIIEGNILPRISRFVLVGQAPGGHCK